MMAPRRQTLLLLAALVLLLVPLVLVPRAAAATTTYYVDTITDAVTTCANPLTFDSDCSLRRAIELANGDMGPSVIKIWAGIANQVITLADPNIGLPELNDPAGGTTIDAAVSGVPGIAINGSNSTVSGLMISGAANVINGISVYGFDCSNQGGGAVVISGSNNTLSNSYIGLTLNGAAPATPTCNGVVLRGGAVGNLLKDNTISGNKWDGVLIQDASDNRLIGNRIGLAPIGTTIIPNLQNGIEVGTLITLTTQTLRNEIGGSSTTINGQNVISGNGTGIRILGSNTLTTTVLSNYIGTDNMGSVDLGNGGDGVFISGGASGTILQGSNSQLLLISGNAGYGVRVTGAGVKNTTITSAYVGVNGIGGDVVGPSYLTATIRNDLGGIRVDSGPTNTSIVGGVERTIIAGNGGRGISIEGAATTTTRVEGALIGLVPISGAGTPSASLPNVGGGVVVEDARSTSVLSNTISGNSLVGLRVSRALTTTVSGNLVGVNLAGTGSLPNVGSGIELFDAGNTTLATNIISGNQAGVVLSNTLTTTVFSNTVTGNTLNGVLLHGATGSSVLSNTITANQAGGLLLETAVPTATTGTSIYTNTISGNPQFGLRLSGALTTTLRSNYVGLNLARTGTLPNLGNGIEVFDSRNTNATNSFVAGNSGAGIVISGTGTVSTTFNNTIAGLALVYDGLTSSFTLTATNTGPAVWITGGARQTTLSAGALGGGATPTTPGPPGVRIENTSAVTVSSSIRIGWVPNGSASASPVARPFSTGISVTGMVSNVVIDSSLLSYNQGPGIALTGVVSNVQILANTLNYNQGPGISLPDSVSNVNILTNTLRFNRDAAIAVTGNAQRVRMLSNALSGNGAGISLARSSVLTTRPATSDTSTASLTNPNHDIDPPPVDVTTFTDPLRLHVTDAGAIDGYVITSTVRTELGVSPVSACISCTVQIFRPGPVADATPNQGFETLLTYPVNGNAVDATPAFSVTDSGRFTRQIFGGLGTIGSQLLLIATDGFGNSSEYSVFTHTTGISLTNLTGPTSHAPGDVVTYTLRLTNMGSLDVTGLRLQTQDTLKDWGVSTNPVTNTLFTLPTPLEANTSRLLTVTLTLPKGSNPSVQAGLTDVTRVSVVKDGSTLAQTVNLETTVLPRPVLVVSPTVSLGAAKPSETVPHTHVIRNDGNVAVTVGITGTSVSAVGATGLWATAISSAALTLGPGSEARVGVNVTVPSGAQVLKPDGNPVQAITYLTATVLPTADFGAVTLPFSDTTRVTLSPAALYTNNNQVEDGAASKTTIFIHTIENRSNNMARFCFVWSATPGNSTVSFQSLNQDIPLDTNGCFTLDTVTEIAAKRYNSLQFQASVLVDRRSLPGTTEIITLAVREQTTQITIGPGVTDRVNVIYGTVMPRLYLPLVQR